MRAHRLNESDVEVIHQLSDLYLSLGSLEAAEKMVRKGLSLDGSNVKLLYDKARLYSKQKDYPTVIEAVEKAMAQGDTTDYYQMMVGIAYIKVDSLDRGIEHLQALVKRKQDNEHTHHYLGLAYLGKGETEEGKKHLEKAIELGVTPKMGRFQADLASVLEDGKDYAGAIEHYRKAWEYGGRPKHLFFLARNCDLYYKDKSIALRYYRQYLDTDHMKFREYSRQRIAALKEIIHFQQ